MVKVAAMLALAFAASGPFELKEPDALAISGTAFDGNATVYVFRGGSSPTRPFYVNLDKSIRGTIGRETYIRFGVSSEPHVFKGSPMQEGSEPSAAIVTRLSPDKTYYFSLNTDFELLSGSLMQQKTSLVQISPAAAEKLLRTYHERPTRK